MVIFIYNQKTFVRRRLRRYRLRHEIHAIKTRPNNPLRILQRKNSIRRNLSNDLTCDVRKTTFSTRKRFHNKQNTSKSKDQPFESERTHFYVRFNKSNVTMLRQTIIFLLSHKITTVQQKTKHNKHEKPSHQLTAKSITRTTTTNNPHNLSKNTLKTKHNKHEKLSHQSITKSITQNIRNKQSTQPLNQKHAQNKHDNPSRHTPRF